jgi:hypothetical protein
MGSCINCGGRLKRRRPYAFKSAAFRKVYRDNFVYVCTHCELHQADVSKIDEAGLLKYYRTEYRAIAKIGVGDPGHRWYRARAAALAELAAEHSLMFSSISRIRSKWFAQRSTPCRRMGLPLLKCRMMCRASFR